MHNKKPFGSDQVVKIDVAHAHLITGLVKSNKPKTLLEFGIGGGEATDAILVGLDYNQQSYEYTVVDNWHDWQGVQPEGITQRYGDKIKVITSAEKDYVFACKTTYDFIMSDGDHHQTDQWFEYVYANLLNPNGILIYHDVNLFDDDAFKNLNEIYYRCQQYNIRHHLFNQNSLPDERCQRGLLVIFKD